MTGFCMAMEEEDAFASADKDEMAPLAKALMERHFKGNFPLTEEKERNFVVEYSDRCQNKQRKYIKNKNKLRGLSP
jgi:hypothetical protein